MTRLDMCEMSLIRTVCECACTMLCFIKETGHILYIPSLIVSRISAGCGMKTSADRNRTRLQFSHCCSLRDVVPVLLIICFFNPATHTAISSYLSISAD